MKRVAVICFRYPWPAVSGDRIRIAQQIDMIADVAEIEIFCFGDPSANPRKYQHGGTEILVHTVPLRRIDWLRGGLTFLHGKEAMQVGTYGRSNHMRKLLSRRNQIAPFDRVFISLVRMWPLITCFPTERAVIDYCDCLSEQYKQRSLLAPRWSFEHHFFRREAKLIRMDEQAAGEHFSVRLVSTAEEAKACMGPSFRVLPNCWQFSAQAAIHHEGYGSRMVFSGDMSSIGNLQAVQWMEQHLLSHLERIGSPWTLTLVGANPRRELFEFAKRYPDKVKVSGYVPDMASALRNADLYICPLLQGTGIKTRLLAAIDVGLPIISTTYGSAGLNLPNGEAIVIRDDPSGFFDAVVSLMKDSDERNRLSQGARRLALKAFDAAAIAERLASALDLYPNTSN